MISTLEEAVERALAAEAALERAERERDDYCKTAQDHFAFAAREQARAQKAEAVVVLEIEQRQKAEEDRHGWYIELVNERGKVIEAQTKLEKAEAELAQLKAAPYPGVAALDESEQA